ncbi:hypothetical protein HII31_02758 [Pseudocercospora fuligena]|uniref:Heterokaryon incompatibility domain-containing protein n=1 Tax=Pseudocercospora fuligena TaxID=685502 RepID=A0A8H6RS23_9PEZI|nr:hypothetical protein HII31_02758 [Pseudocercospora fuligena]
MWFFQRRSAFLNQKVLPRWNRDRLHDYVLLPASNGFVTRRECFFVSHFWRSSDDPDPDGEFLRRFQKALRSERWSYIWVDWTCVPQAPRSYLEARYFVRSLETVGGLIRNCTFIWFYPPFEPRLWILYEIAEYFLTCEGPEPPQDDIREFYQHIGEMKVRSVDYVLSKYGYRCKNDLDRRFLTTRLELLILMDKLNFDTSWKRLVFDDLTWHTTTSRLAIALDGLLEIDKFEGTFDYAGQVWNFTPFPRWNSLFGTTVTTLPHE